MKNRNIGLSASSAAIALLFSSAALAEISAEDVWNSWKNYAETTGQNVTVGSEEKSGDALILHAVRLHFAMPEGSVSSTIELLEFRERGDGTVAVTMSPDMPISLSMKPEDGEAVDLAIIFRQSGLSIIASGEPDDVKFDYLVSRVEMDVDKLIVDGEAVEATIGGVLSDIDGKYSLHRGEVIEYDSEMAARELTYAVMFTDPEGNGKFDIAGKLSDLKTDSTARFPENIDMNDPTAMFQKDVSIVGSFSTGPSESNVEIVDGNDGFSIRTSAQSNQLDIAVNEGTIAYGGGSTGVAYAISSPQIPIPEINVNAAEVAARLEMPIVKTVDVRDFGFLLKLRDLEINDMIWQMFDPAAVMPRDPMTVVLDIAGKMKWLIDITDPEAVEKYEGENPAYLEVMTIKELELSAAGAEITGTGEFTFDNSDLKTFDGMPAPDGSINLNLVGMNGLIDRLIQMGILPDDQAMGMRMMLGLFARPAGGEDTLVSEIEIKPDGSIFANGQQLK